MPSSTLTKPTELTEREKMLAGLPYHSREPELLALHGAARSFMATFNAMCTASQQERWNQLNSIFAHVGENVWIEPPFFCDYGCHISIGKNSFVNFNCVFLDCNTITIGENVLIAPAVQIYTVAHPINPKERFKTDITKPIVIKDNVWIGGGVIILPGITIGEGSVIGAGSVVTKDIPAYSVAVGNPCRVTRSIS